MGNFLPVEIIKKKRNAHELTTEEIQFFIDGYTKGTIPDYQMSAFLMATYFKGMTSPETLALTAAMINSGSTVSHITQKKKIDKHSTGGVGDKTSLIIGPIVAAAGVAVPMISGRGLGHTGGTLDKLESIPGFNTQLPLDRFKSMIDDLGVSFIGQTSEICPADKKIYALRDVTGTVESFPLICASIMSKKMAEGIDGLVLDVKYGNGAFIKSLEESILLANRLREIGIGYGKKVTALITNMNQPLGEFAGNALEARECLEILQGITKPNYSDTLELSLQLSAHMILLGGAAKTIEAAYQLALDLLKNKKALGVFNELISQQGGRIDELPNPKPQVVIAAAKSGYVQSIQTENIGMIGIKIKMGRRVISDIIDPIAGFQFHKKIGDPISAGEPMISLYGSNKDLIESVKIETANCFKIGEAPMVPVRLIEKVIS